MRRPVIALAVALSLIVLTSSAVTITERTGPAVPPGSKPAGLATDAIPLPLGSPERELVPSTPISLTLTLTSPHAAELSRFLIQVEDPASPLYRHFITSAEYTAEFAPTASSVAAVELVLSDAGAREFTVAPDRTAVTALLPAHAVEQLLGVDLVAYGSLGRVGLYTAVGTPTLPPSLVGLVSGVGGLSDAATAEIAAASSVSPSPREVPGGFAQFVQNQSTGEDWYIGSDYTEAFGATALFPGPHSVAGATYPTSVAIATLLASSYNDTTNSNLPPWDPQVVKAYFNGTLGPGWPLPNFTGVPVTINGVTPPPAGSLGAENDDSEFEIENSLDLEMTGSMAPGASIYNFYFAGSLLAGSATDGDVADYFASDLDAALNYSYSPAHLATVSCSFGVVDLNDTFWSAELLRAAAMGVTILAASGDQGNAPDQYTGRTDGQWPVWPATDATNVSGALSVGGVSLTIAGTPSTVYNGSELNLTYDASDGPITSLSAWYDTLGGQGAYSGTEGGVSTVFPEPSWQFDSAAQPSIVNATVTQGASSLGRAGPDLAMPGNVTIATIAANTTGTIFFTVVEGTSIACPVLAGLLADVVAVENNRVSGPWTSLGFIDPEIYRIASYYAAFPSATPSDPFTAVTSGGNYVFTASAGWDALTGWGVVNASAFLAVDENLTILNYRYNGTTPGLPPVSSSSSGGPVPWAYIYAIFGVGIVLAVVLVLIAARPRRPQYAGGVPWGAQMGGPEGSSTHGAPGATFQCPYCGGIRPAEPVRCPQCGRY